MSRPRTSGRPFTGATLLLLICSGVEWASNETALQKQKPPEAKKSPSDKSPLALAAEGDDWHPAEDGFLRGDYKIEICGVLAGKQKGVDYLAISLRMRTERLKVPNWWSPL